MTIARSPLTLLCAGALLVSGWTPAQEAVDPRVEGRPLDPRLEDQALEAQALADLSEAKARYADVRRTLEDARIGLERAELQEQLLLARAPLERAGRFDAELSELRIREVELDVRREALEHQLARLEKEMHAAVAQDALARRLEEAIAQLEEVFDPAKYVDFPADKGLEVKLRVIELTVELEARRDQVRDRVGADLLGTLRHRILDADVELAVLRARRDALREEQSRVASLEEEWQQHSETMLHRRRHFADLQDSYEQALLELQRVKDRGRWREERRPAGFGR